jgi:rod shape-determining protein MreB
MSYLDKEQFRKWLGVPDVAIDLGTANTRLFAAGQGIVADEPSVVTIFPWTGEITAVGREATQLAMSDSGMVSLYPLSSGVVSNIEAATELLRHLFERVAWHGLLKPRALACIPSDACEEERNSLIESARRAGASAVALVPEPLAAAVGAGLDITSPYAQMLVDIGDGVTDIAVIQSSALITTAAVRTACSDLHAAISEIVAARYGVRLLDTEAQRLTHRIGSIADQRAEEWLFAQGNVINSEESVTLRISNFDLVEGLEPVLRVIIDAIHHTVRELPPKISCEVIENGIILTGGGANLRGISSRLATATSLSVRAAANPMQAVINGARQMLQVGAETRLWS